MTGVGTMTDIASGQVLEIVREDVTVNGSQASRRHSVVSPILAE